MGGHDPDLEIWGGENFELSFKVVAEPSEIVPFPTILKKKLRFTLGVDVWRPIRNRSMFTNRSRDKNKCLLQAIGWAGTGRSKGETNC